jgi:tetratricopeptide (TPR) repeat protein
MQPDTSLGPYRIDRELGSGGMGKVYAATGPDGVVALKVVHPHLIQTPGFFKRFMREAQLGQSIRHENVVRTLDCDQDFSGGKATCFLVMEYVEGQTLSELLHELERVPEELCRHVAREICKGLAAVHDAGVVHRDLKPENVLITPDHVVKIMDLGVAQVADEALRLSKSGAFVGSVEYAAPEQFKGGDVDGRTDLHALGVLLYELATGTHPYRGGSFHEVLGRVCDQDARRLGDVNPQLSAFFEEVVHTLLVKDPRGRFASATKLLDVLEQGEDSDWWHGRARSLQAETKRPIRRIRISRETAVYGREKELAQLRSLYERATAGDGQVVLIEGEAGIGKSRLVDELIARLHADGEDLNFLFGSYPPGGAATATGGFSAAYREHFGESGSADHLTQTPILAPAFDALLKGESAPTGVEQLTKDSLQTCFVNATRSIAAERVTVVLIDDLHFAPDEGRALFTALAMAAPGSRVLLVGTTRPGVSEEWLAGVTRLDQTSHVPVDRLSPKDLIELLRDNFKSEDLAIGLAGKIALKSDGNPFFIFEIIRGLREGQFITKRDDGTWATTRIIDEIEIPSSVLDLVNARVAALTEEERDLLDVACCWGYEFDPGLIGDVLEMRRIPLLKRFGQIERAHRLVRASGRNYVFDHHQVQEALYSTLHEQMREEYHAALAEALEARTNAVESDPEALDGALCVDLCEHYLKGARGESALRYLEAAQSHLSEGYLNAQVVALCERALAVPDLLTGAERAKALVRLVRALDVLGRRTRLEEYVREAERLAEGADDDELRGHVTNVLGSVLLESSRHEQGWAAFRRSLDLARARGDKAAEAGATVNMGNVFWVQRRLAEAQEWYERGLALCREIGHKRFESIATGNLGNVLESQGRLAEAQEHFERALALSREIGYRLGAAVATENLGMVFRSQGRLAEAQEHFERSLALNREIGRRQGEASATGSLGAVFSSQGRLAEAQEHHERSLALSREIGYRKGELLAQHNLRGVLRELGDTEGSEERLVASLALCEELGDRHLAVPTKRALGSLRAATRGVEEGRELLVEARDAAAEIGLPGDEVLAYCELALLPGEHAEDALSAYTEHVERLSPGERQSARYLLFRATGDRTHLEEAKRLLDELLAKNPPEYHGSMCQNIGVHREILAAWREEFGEDDDSSGGASPTESPTRAG